MPELSKSARVAESVRAMIHDGRLREGDPLPSTRALAAQLGVARGTVVAAFEQLDGEGYLTTRHGAPTRVAATLAGLAAPLTSAPPLRAEKPAPSPPRVIDLTPGVPAVTAIAERDWRSAWRHAAAVPLRDAYPDRLGEPELRAEIAKQLGFSRGFAPPVDRVVVTAGTAEALSLVAEALGPAPRVAVENPGYRSGRGALAGAGAELVPIELDEHGLRLDRLRAAHARAPLAAVSVTPSHQYPMGAVMPIGRRHELLAWAAGEGVVVIEDDYDSEFRHHGAPLPALAAIDTAGVVLHIGSFSKVLNPQLRCGYLVLPEAGATADRVRSARVDRGAVVASPTQHAIAWLMSSGALRRHVARLRRDYTHKRAMVADAFAGLSGVHVSALAGGLHATVEWEGTRDEEAVVAGIRRRGVVVAPLRDYVVTGSGLDARGFVLGYGHVPASALARALDAMIAELGGR
ncbi:pyridoxine biosynthesis transcriptional regulator PdxR [Gryllotalpicola daejeonensis]|uniref:Pyridoxine biosynthesis transcriptional regulator PdxR n=1 Tax=Gryllotalpicola daejeonensis TaxID=993087 RepID=A0ABP7ZIZ1_9MICO